MNFANSGLSLCGVENPSFLWFFDLSTPPSLLYYSYIPAVIASLLVTSYVFSKDKKSLKSRLLLTVAIFFSLWVINILVQWVASYHTLLMFAWQLTAVLEIGIFLFTAYFCRVFLYDRDISILEKITSSVIIFAVLVAIPTSFNVAMYDIENCEGANGLLWNMIYAFEPAVIVLMVYWGFNAYRQEKDSSKRKQIAIFTGGIAFFLTTFFLSNFYGELTKIYEFNLWGPVGVVIFLVLLAYMIVRYRTFHIKLFATQALVAGITLLIGARLFYSTTEAGFILSLATLVAFLVSGVFLIKSVKREVEQREKIEKLAKKLQVANEGQADLLHIINHQIKGYLAKGRNIFSELLSDPGYGPIPEPSKPMLQEGFDSLTEGVNFVQDFLTAANIEKGTFTYDMKPIDFKAIVSEVAEKQKDAAGKKGLSFDLMLADGTYDMKGDASQLGQAVKNLIDNSIRYTPKGGLAVNLSREGDKALLRVEDTGVGISEDLKPRLFTKGGKGRDSIKINVNSTGFGLSFVKGVVEAHKGRVWAESEGPDKGSTFYMELPINS